MEIFYQLTGRQFPAIKNATANKHVLAMCARHPNNETEHRCRHRNFQCQDKSCIFNYQNIFVMVWITALITLMNRTVIAVQMDKPLDQPSALKTVQVPHVCVVHGCSSTHHMNV